MNKYRTSDFIIPVIALFGHYRLFGSYVILFLLILSSLIIDYFFDHSRKISITKNASWYLLTVLMFISYVYSSNQDSTLRYAIIYAFLFACILLYKGINDQIVKWIFTLSALHVVFTYIHALYPEVMMNINRVFLSNTDLEINLSLQRAGAFAGLNAQTATNGFYISIFTGISFVNGIRSSKRPIWMMLVLIGYIAITLTSKRIFVLSNIMIMILISFLSNIIDTKLRFVLIFAATAFGLFLAINYVPEINLIYNRIVYTSTAYDISNGRSLLWNSTMNVFMAHPVFGVGFGAIDVYIGEYSHNIYLQVLSELGMIGFVLLISLFLTDLHSLLKKVLQKEVSSLSMNLSSLYVYLLLLLYGISGNPIYNISILLIYLMFIKGNNNEAKHG